MHNKRTNTSKFSLASPKGNIYLPPIEVVLASGTRWKNPLSLYLKHFPEEAEKLGINPSRCDALYRNGVSKKLLMTLWRNFRTLFKFDSQQLKKIQRQTWRVHKVHSAAASWSTLLDSNDILSNYFPATFAFLEQRVSTDYQFADKVKRQKLSKENSSVDKAKLLLSSFSENSLIAKTKHLGVLERAIITPSEKKLPEKPGLHLFLDFYLSLFAALEHDFINLSPLAPHSDGLTFGHVVDCYQQQNTNSCLGAWLNLLETKLAKDDNKTASRQLAKKIPANYAEGMNNTNQDMQYTDLKHWRNGDYLPSFEKIKGLTDEVFATEPSWLTHSALLSGLMAKTLDRILKSSVKHYNSNPSVEGSSSSYSTSLELLAEYYPLYKQAIQRQ